MSLRLLLASVALLAWAGCNCGDNLAQCKTNADCADPAKRYCSKLAQLCVECAEDTNCPSGRCLADGTCSECGPNTLCQSGQLCGDDGRCVDGCATETENCAVGKYCLPGSAECVDCTLDTHCGPGRVCSPTHTCVPGCSAQNPTCPQGQVCNQAGHTCVACLSHGDCHAPTGTCELSTHTCVACVSETDCAAGYICRNHTCAAGCTATHGCPLGQQCNVPTGQCVQCLSDGQCAAATPRCDPQSLKCVECLTGPSDNCPAGEYCRADHACERGCNAGADCPSGVCLADHSCQACAVDAECVAGKVCISGVCTAACSAANPCGQGNSCCGQRCVNRLTDSDNCGACGASCGSATACCNGQCTALDTADNCGVCGLACAATEGCCGGACRAINTQLDCGGCGIACGPDQFCDGTNCITRTFPNFCANKKVYAIYDGISIDDAATDVLASTIEQNCPVGTVISYGPQSNPLWVDQSTGALLLGGGSTVVTAGGPFPNRPLKWLERTQQVTKVYFATNNIDTYYFKLRSNDSIITSLTAATCSPHHDRFLVELATDPINGTLALIAYGVCSGGYGTQAGAFYWANVMLPNRSAYPDSWYIYDWMDANNDSIANSGDTFTKLASGL